MTQPIINTDHPDVGDMVNNNNSNDLPVNHTGELVTPIKPLPFSPSQFLTSPNLNLTGFDNLTVPASTPVKKSNQVNRRDKHRFNRFTCCYTN